MTRGLPIICLTLSCFLGPWAASAEPTEYAAKARLMLMTLSYVQWPSQSSWKEGPVQIAVLGESPFGSRLEEVARTLTIHHRPIQIRQISRVREAEGCQALFVCASEARQLDGILAWARGREVLTMSDDEAIAKRGVMLNFLIEDGFVRLVVNPVATQGAGLQLGSRLMSLARIVTTARTAP